MSHYGNDFKVYTDFHFPCLVTTRLSCHVISLLKPVPEEERHSSKVPCEGSSLNGAFYINGIADWKKEILHTGGYTDPRGITKATDSHIVIRWIGWRAIMYNINDDNAELGALQSILYSILSSNMLFDVFDVPFDEMLAYLTYHLTAGIS